jgi:predicted anti-sigma-YlaC factor YlaD
MTDINCESVQVAAMALADGEEGQLRTEEIETHLFNCERCREEIGQLLSTNTLFSSQKRLRSETDLWPLINERIQATAGSERPFRWRVLLLFGIPLFAYKILLVTVQATPSLWSRLVPIVLVIGVFSYLRANPFKINSELRLEGETTL